MILFDLVCAAGHVFEGWFGSSEDYDAQLARGLVTCPLCGDASVAKAPMAPRLGSSGASQAPAAPAAASGAPAEFAELKTAMAKLARLQRKLVAQSDYVGARFADEARAIHLGERDARAIHGEATRDEAARLADEGIEIAPLPFPIVPPAAEN